MEPKMELSSALSLIRDIPNFPIPGIIFKDISPLLSDSRALHRVASELADAGHSFTQVAGIEARGFIFGSAIATLAGAGFVPIRKAGKLPFETISESYGLEYGVDTLEIHVDALSASDTVLVVDDVLATGGTILASLDLLERLGSKVAAVSVLIEIESLAGREKILSKYPELRINSLLKVSE